jgi:hypothetical protein
MHIPDSRSPSEPKPHVTYAPIGIMLFVCLELVAACCCASSKPPPASAPTSSPSAPTATATAEAADSAITDTSSSDISLFLIGSGFALFVALLAWSEQIQSMKKDTRDLEAKFISSTTVDKRVFFSLMKSADPEDQLDALTQLLASSKLRTVPDVKVLGLFRTWYSQSQRLERYYLWKYRLTVGLTLFLFGGGVTTQVVSDVSLSLFSWKTTLPLAIAASSLLLILIVLAVVLAINSKERRFHELLAQISETVL